MQIEELLNEEAIYFRSAGKDILVHCLNPEHSDSNPSMRIDKITGLFNCFSCGFKGNIFTHYGKAIDVLSIQAQQLKKKINNIMSNETLMPLGTEPFRRKHRGISAETYREFGAFIHDDYDGRIVFPIRDITGRLIALMGRYAFSDASPKYLIMPPGVDMPLFPPKPEIYQDTVILVEGIFDVLNLWDKGMKNVICAFGKSLGEARKRKVRENNIIKFLPFKIQGIKKIYILYDSGAERSANKLVGLLDELFIVEVINYPNFTKDKDCGNLTQTEVDDLKEYIYDTSSDS